MLGESSRLVQKTKFFEKSKLKASLIQTLKWQLYFQGVLDRYFHDAQWVRKHWDLDIDFDTDSEDDATFGEYLSSDSLEKEENPVKVASEHQPVQDEEDRLVQGGAQDVSEEDCDALSEEANHGVEQEEVCMEMREPTFSDRSIPALVYQN